MKIAIVGAVAEGKTHFVENVLFRALLRDDNQDYGFEIYEDGGRTAYRSGTPVLYIATFTAPEEAAAWLKSPAVQP